jgi:hypothetical protein
VKALLWPVIAAFPIRPAMNLHFSHFPEEPLFAETRKTVDTAHEKRRDGMGEIENRPPENQPAVC